MRSFTIPGLYINEIDFSEIRFPIDKEGEWFYLDNYTGDSPNGRALDFESSWINSYRRFDSSIPSQIKIG